MGNPLKPVGVHPFEYYIQNGYEYVIVHSDKYRGFIKKDSKLSKNFPSFHQFYIDLFEKGHLLKEFVPEKSVFKGPVVKIYEIRRSKNDTH